MNVVRQIGNLTENPKIDNPQANRVYDSKGISPTLNCMEGGNRQPMIIEDFYKNREPRAYDETAPTIRAEREGLKVIVASRGRNPDNPSDRKQGIELEQRLEPNSEGICNTLTSVQKDNLVLEPAILTPKRTEYGKAIRKDYENGKIQESRHNMTELRPREDGISNTLTTVTKDNLLIENCYDFYNNKLRTDKCTGTITTNSNATGSGVFGVIEPTYRIRKLTPLECWRLMGFTDEDFYKAKFVFENEQSLEKLTREKFYNILYSNLSETKKLYHIERLKIKTKERTSNTQLYKQAGNSIVVKVLEAIFKQML